MSGVLFNEGVVIQPILGSTIHKKTPNRQKMCDSLKEIAYVICFFKLRRDFVQQIYGW